MSNRTNRKGRPSIQSSLNIEKELREYFLLGYEAEFIAMLTEHDLKKDLVSFATDSILVTREIKMDSEKLGEFGFDGSGDDVFQLQNGIGRMNGKWKLRGLGKLGKKEVEHVATKEKDGRLYIEYIVKRTKQLASAIIQGKINDIGRIKVETREVNLNADQKRFWIESLKNVKDKTRNRSYPLTPQQFPKAFELNDDYVLDDI